jgi:hypothetical protein
MSVAEAFFGSPLLTTCDVADAALNSNRTVR